MKKKIFKLILILTVFLYFSKPAVVQADFWGGDIPLLIEIVANTAHELIELKSILGKGAETLSYIQEINRGIQDAMNIIRTQNTSLSPGVLSQYKNLEQVMGIVEQLYGKVPSTPEAQMQRTTDQSVSEAIQMHNEAFKYADTIDPEAERIKEYSKGVSPAGAQKLTAQSLGVLIHVMNQVLRTNAEILKLNSEQLAHSNRKEKLESEHFKIQYEGLAKAFKDLKPEYSLPKLSGL